jgi:hypothetical protein
MAGVFFPSPEGALPVDLKHELFEKLSAEIGWRLKASGASEKEIQSDFESWRKRAVKLAVDANVRLAALIGGRARRVLGHPRIEEVLTTAAALAEVQEYAGQLARKKRLPVDLCIARRRRAACDYRRSSFLVPAGGSQANRAA